MVEDGSKDGPRWYQDGPKWSQDGPRRSQNRLSSSKRGPRRPRPTHDRPKTAQNEAKKDQDRPKTTPKRETVIRNRLLAFKMSQCVENLWGASADPPQAFSIRPLPSFSKWAVTRLSHTKFCFQGSSGPFRALSFAPRLDPKAILYCFLLTFLHTSKKCIKKRKNQCKNLSEFLLFCFCDVFFAFY